VHTQISLGEKKKGWGGKGGRKADHERKRTSESEMRVRVSANKEKYRTRSIKKLLARKETTLHLVIDMTTVLKGSDSGPLRRKKLSRREKRKKKNRRSG